MPAFNTRLKSKEIFGMPFAAAIGLAVALIFFVLSLMLPVVLKFVTIPVMLAGLAVAAAAFYLGDELQWFGVMRLGRFVENKRITSELGRAGIMSRQYADLYTWSHPYGEFAICHQDGASSVSIAWDGFDAEMLTTGENATKWTELYTLIGLLGLEYCAEFHCWRESDASLADEYLEHNSKIIRGREIAVAVRCGNGCAPCPVWHDEPRFIGSDQTAAQTLCRLVRSVN